MALSEKDKNELAEARKIFKTAGYEFDYLSDEELFEVIKAIYKAAKAGINIKDIANADIIKLGFKAEDFINGAMALNRHLNKK